MKKTLLALSLALACNIGFAQERQTLVGSGDMAHGGMGGLDIKTGVMKDDLNIMVGGKGAYLMDHRLYIGGGGYGTTMQMSANDTNYVAGFGGVLMGYKFFPHRLVHFGMELMVGSGGLSEAYDYSTMDDVDMHQHRGDAFFFTEPSLYAAVNIAPYFKIHTGVSYRYVKGVNTSGFSDSDLSGLSASVSLLWGKF